MRHVHHWERWCQTIMSILLFSVGVHVSFAQCVLPGTTISFSSSGQNTTAGYTTSYVLTDGNGSILSSFTSLSVAAPTTAGNYNIYSVNYNTSAGYTAPTLTAGTNITAIGGTCVAISSSLPISVCTTSASPVATVGTNPSSTGGATGSIILSASTTSYPASTPVSVTYTTPAGTTAIYSGTTDATGKIIIPNLTAGTYGPFTVAINNGSPSSTGGSVTLVDTVNGCYSPGTTINFSSSGNNTTSGYVTSYVLTNASGGIVSSSTTQSVTAPNADGSYLIYAVNYSTAAGTTAPTLTTGTNITAIGGTCVATSASPLTFCVETACITPNTVLSFASNGNNTGTGYTTTYALVNASGAIISTSTATTVTTPVTGGTYSIYAINYSTANGAGAPTLTAGTNITAIGGTCTAISSTPLTFKVCAPSTPVASVVSNPTSSGTSTGSISLTATTGAYPVNTPVSVTYTSPSGTTAVYSGTTDGSGKITIPNLPAGEYGPFLVSLNGGTPSSPSNKVTLTDPPVPDLTPIITALPTTVHNTTNITVTVDVAEINNVPTSGLIKVYVTKDPKVSLTFNPSATTIGGQAVVNSVWTFDATSNANYYILTTNQVIGALNLLSFGFTGTLTPASTKGLVTISVVVIGGSESPATNNTDAEKIDYFPQ